MNGILPSTAEAVLPGLPHVLQPSPVHELKAPLAVGGPEEVRHHLRKEMVKLVALLLGTTLARRIRVRRPIGRLGLAAHRIPPLVFGAV